VEKSSKNFVRDAAKLLMVRTKSANAGSASLNSSGLTFPYFVVMPASAAASRKHRA
jgi:hypothetical protein